jgi:uncharacterized protein (DUF1501 family)
MLGVTAGLFSWAFMPRYAEAASADPRLLVVILRGGMDGLSTVVPHGDINYFSMRGELAMPASATTPLNNFFGLHPALQNFGTYYAAGDAAVVHATCVPLHNRSHFDAQDVLETGYPDLRTRSSGWLNRLLATLPAGAPIKTHGALEVGEAPLILRGPAPVLGWSPKEFEYVEDPILYMIRTLYRSQDAQMFSFLERGLQTARFAEGFGADPPQSDAVSRSFRGAGRLLAAPDGPRIAVISVHGWDTHTAQGGVTGRLADRLASLDQGLAGFKAVVGSVWQQTVIAMVTEFGRTVQNNGNEGSDHGVGTVALLAGGAVNGRRIVTDWPGLKLANLQDGRDLKATTDLRSVFKGILRDHLGVPGTILNQTVFPESTAAPALRGLVKT